MNILILFGAFFVVDSRLLPLKESDDVSRTVIYYEPRTRLPLQITSIQNSLSNFTSGSKPDGEDALRRVAFRSNGCTCQEFTCGCCTVLNFQQFNFNREACTNFTYDPYEFAINMDMVLDDNTIFSTSFSAKNPPPLCMPIPIQFLPTVDFCAKLYDIYTPGQNLHMCLNLETRIDKATILILNFNCMRMGANGVALVRPGESDIVAINREMQANSEKNEEIAEIKHTTEIATKLSTNSSIVKDSITLEYLEEICTAFV